MYLATAVTRHRNCPPNDTETAQAVNSVRRHRNGPKYDSEVDRPVDGVRGWRTPRSFAGVNA